MIINMNKKIITLVMTLMITLTSVFLINRINVNAQEDYTQLAEELSMNGVWSDHWMTETNPEQWYKINVPADGKVTIKIMGYMSYMDYNFYNSDLRCELISRDNFYGSETSPATHEHTLSLSQGTYYLKVCKDGDNTGKFRINISYENYNVNDYGADSYDNPYNLSIGSNITGALTETDTEDWYRFSIPVSGYYSVKITTYAKYMDFYLYNQDMTKKIASAEYFYGTDTAPATKYFDVTLTSGVYYIKMSKYNTGKYFLSLNQLTPSNCTHDYKTEYVEATYLNKGYTRHTCKKCGHIYNSDYTNKIRLSQVYLYNVYSKSKGKLNLNYSSVSDATGYMVRYSTNKKFKKGVKYIKTKKYGNISSGKKRRGKRYYVQVRAYKKIGGKTVYGKWSTKKSTVIKR